MVILVWVRLLMRWIVVIVVEMLFLLWIFLGLMR